MYISGVSYLQYKLLPVYTALLPPLTPSPAALKALVCMSELATPTSTLSTYGGVGGRGEGPVKMADQSARSS